MARPGLMLGVFLAVAALTLAAGRPLNSTGASTEQQQLQQQQQPASSITFRQSAPVPLTERVYFNPNNGEDNKIEDYIANFYVGEVDLAEADPVIAATGLGAGAGMQFQYQSGSYFDYENPTSEANIGPGAKAIAAAVGRVLGVTSTKAAARGAAKTNLAYTRDAFKSNKVTLGTATELSGGASGGLYLDRTAGGDNNDLLEAPAPTNFIFG